MEVGVSSAGHKGATGQKEYQSKGKTDKNIEQKIKLTRKESRKFPGWFITKECQYISDYKVRGHSWPAKWIGHQCFANAFIPEDTSSFNTTDKANKRTDLSLLGSFLCCYENVHLDIFKLISCCLYLAVSIPILSDL